MNRISRYLLFLAWIQALIATFGSLYFSEILRFPPCNLCWYQRIFMYPLVAIIAAGILRRDKGLPIYVLPLSITGGLIALYQTVLQEGIISQEVAPCSLGVSCTVPYIDIFGFITIPFLSFLAFLFISVSMVVFLKYNREL